VKNTFDIEERDEHVLHSSFRHARSP